MVNSPLTNFQQCRRLAGDGSSFTTAKFVQQAVGQLQFTENQPIEIIQQLATKIPWGHNILIFSKSKALEEVAPIIEAQSVFCASGALLGPKSLLSPESIAWSSASHINLLILLRALALQRFELAVEIGYRIESTLIPHLGNRHFARQQQFTGVTNADFAHKI